MDDIDKAMSLWIGRISQPQESLGGNSVCPFAKKLPPIVKTSKLNSKLFENLSDELTIFCETKISSSFSELEKLCMKLSKKYPSHIFLPDHPYRKTYIKDVETGNKCYPLIVAQTKPELESARNSLSKTDYYSYWDKKYLEEIFGYGNLDRMGQTN